MARDSPAGPHILRRAISTLSSATISRSGRKSARPGWISLTVITSRRESRRRAPRGSKRNSSKGRTFAPQSHGATEGKSAIERFGTGRTGGIYLPGFRPLSTGTHVRHHRPGDAVGRHRLAGLWDYSSP